MIHADIRKECGRRAMREAASDVEDVNGLILRFYGVDQIARWH